MTITNIEWTDRSWNFLRGCSRVSEGCRNCYAELVALRFSGKGLPYEGLAVRAKSGGARWTGEVRFVRKKLADPLRWQKPQRIFVNSMSDLFHEGVPFEVLAAAFGVMACARRHTFQILTKRPERGLAFCRWLEDLAANRNTTPIGVLRVYRTAHNGAPPAGVRTWTAQLSTQNGGTWNAGKEYTGDTPEAAAAQIEAVLRTTAQVIASALADGAGGTS